MIKLASEEIHAKGKTATKKKKFNASQQASSDTSYIHGEEVKMMRAQAETPPPPPKP